MSINPQSSRPADGRTASVSVPCSLLNYLYACPICKEKELQHYCRVQSLFQEFKYINYESCKNCGIVFQNPRMPDDSRLSEYVETPLPIERKRLDPVGQAHYAHMIRILRSLVSDRMPLRLLDFGCGAGGFLLEAKEAGFDVMGLEVSRDFAQHTSAQFNIPVFNGVATDVAFRQEKFNFIISSQVFEHLTDPRATLEVLKTHLEEPGIVLIEVPNLSHIRERMKRGSTMDDSHLFYFNRRSLSRLFVNNGFRVVLVQEGLRPFKLMGYRAAQLPHSFVNLFEKVLSLCQVKTGLSIIAQFIPDC